MLSLRQNKALPGPAVPSSQATPKSSQHSGRYLISCLRTVWFVEGYAVDWHVLFFYMPCWLKVESTATSLTYRETRLAQRINERGPSDLCRDYFALVGRKQSEHDLVCAFFGRLNVRTACVGSPVCSTSSDRASVSFGMSALPRVLGFGEGTLGTVNFPSGGLMYGNGNIS